MLAIISDLHFCDGTATKKNVDPKAFALSPINRAIKAIKP